MSHEPPQAPVQTTQAAQGGGGQKWLIGAAAAAIVFGGGFLAWKNYGQGAELQTASNETYQTAEAPVRAGPLPPLREEAPVQSARAETASAETQVADAAPVRRRAPARADDSVPTETLGVIPVNATESDGIVVEGARRPVWQRRPSARRMAAAYPERALERGREGEAQISCTVQENGALDDCVRVAEFPQNAGFGRAAVRVAHMYRHAPERWDGSDAVGSPVNLRVVFRIAEDSRRNS